MNGATPSFALNLRLGQGYFQFAASSRRDYIWNVSVAENEFLKEAIKQGLRMQHRFLAEPVLARTGKGYLKSEGVSTLQKIKASLKKAGDRHGRAR
ncbi:MAG TPA: hypothetical protein VFV81_01110 [Verrucomicrobiae bacterium]|nr:hypothetical protein [Verrucomicrobiae bacterium]